MKRRLLCSEFLMPRNRSLRQDLASIIQSFQLRQSQLEDEENAISQREMESALGWSG